MQKHAAEKLGIESMEWQLIDMWEAPGGGVAGSAGAWHVL
jgi:hypothetical protein